MKLLLICLLSIVVLSESKREPKFAPYYEIDETPDANLVDFKNKYGLKAVTLAFALAKGGCNPSWGGDIALNDGNLINKIKAFKAAGGDVIVSSGGADGNYLENACGSADELKEAYKKLLNAVQSTHIDLDMEQKINNDKVNEALAALQKENPAISVSYTLGVDDQKTGLGETQMNILRNAAKHGVNVDVVNPMTMDFDSGSDWGQAVIQASEATVKQIKSIWPSKSEAEAYSMLGVTPMIGKNDNGKIFTQEHAKALVAWAKEKNIGTLSFWSLNRDKSCPNQKVQDGCSSIQEGDHDFIKIFGEF